MEYLAVCVLMVMPPLLIFLNSYFPGEHRGVFDFIKIKSFYFYNKKCIDAIRCGDHVGVELFLKNKSVHPDTLLKLLFVSIMQKNHEAMKMILSDSMIDLEGSIDTDIICAVFDDKQDIIEEKVEYGAMYPTPLMFACTLGDLEAVKLLIAAGACVTAQTDHDKGDYSTPFSCAISANNMAVVEYLVNHHYVDVQGTDGDDPIPLIDAVDSGSMEMLEFFLKRIHNVNVVNMEGCTALVFAVCNGDKKMVARLLDAGVDPNIKDEEGETALDTARSWGNEEITALLRSRMNEKNRS